MPAPQKPQNPSKSPISTAGNTNAAKRGLRTEEHDTVKTPAKTRTSSERGRDPGEASCTPAAKRQYRARSSTPRPTGHGAIETDNDADEESDNPDNQSEMEEDFPQLTHEDHSTRLSNALNSLLNVTGCLPEDFELDHTTNALAAHVFQTLCRGAMEYQAAQLMKEILGQRLTELTSSIAHLAKVTHEKHLDTAERLAKVEKATRETQDTVSKLQSNHPTATSSSTSPPNANQQPKTTTALGPTYSPEPKRSTAEPKPKHNPLTAHHPSRLVIQIENGLPADQRPPPHELVNAINSRLQAGEDSKHLRVVSVTWNKNGNCIVFTRQDQAAAELLKFQDRFVDLVAKGNPAIAREDKKWYKIQVDGVRTGAFDAIPNIYSPNTLHAELSANNPIYANLKLTQMPRWMRTREELCLIAHSSMNFAVEDKEQYEHLINNVKVLSAVGASATKKPPVNLIVYTAGSAVAPTPNVYTKTIALNARPKSRQKGMTWKPTVRAILARTS
ncbi:hypothetical protein HWV62_9407 [Athelia sp. TMB]|nr:hypothetical protein HWV62_9407 [Athelia sp. TMB]